MWSNRKSQSEERAEVDRHSMFPPRNVACWVGLSNIARRGQPSSWRGYQGNQLHDRSEEDEKTPKVQLRRILVLVESKNDTYCLQYHRKILDDHEEVIGRVPVAVIWIERSHRLVGDNIDSQIQQRWTEVEENSL